MEIALGKKRIHIRVTDIIRAVIALTVMGFGIWYCAGHFKELMWVYIVFGLLFIPRITFNLKHPWIADIFMPLIAAVPAFYLDHMMSMVGYEYYKNTHSIWLYLFKYCFFARTGVEILFVIFMYAVLRLLFVRPGPAAAFAPLPLILLSLVNYYVYQFRRMIFIPLDIAGFKTAMEVAGNYDFDYSYPLMMMILPYLLVAAALFKMHVSRGDIKMWKEKVICAGLAFVAAVTCLLDVNVFLKDSEAFTFNNIGTIHNGYITNFALLLRDMNPRKPVDYSENRDDVMALVSDSEKFRADGIDDAANIIIIMNESYMDTSLFSDRWTDYVDPDPYWDYYSERSIHGYAVSSVFGGLTPNSEFAVLTGLPTAFLPGGATPYSMYIDHEMFSLASYMKAQGYDTYGIHTYKRYGWSRDKVYPLLGFDDFLSSENITYYSNDLVRGYASDRCSYSKIIDHLDSLPEGQKTFTFLVTMQNHGGYTSKYDNFIPSISLHTKDGKYDLKASMYFSLVKESDKALQYLLSDLKTRDEKYVVLIFGDHQPNIDHDPNMDPGGIGWIVPYIIWTNYDVDTDIKSYEDWEHPTSLNYLGIDVLNAAGVELPPYFEFVDKVREEYPAIGIGGYMEKGKEGWTPIGSLNDDYGKLLNKYRALQYSVLFD
ncbi:MAG: LTA synthase family protein [Clostridiales bacterium]|nr:LTA synthase family protein [Clostridiales bacterium]